ncbi:MAG: OmpA family protein [Chitinophagaceae bacterium]
MPGITVDYLTGLSPRLILHGWSGLGFSSEALHDMPEGTSSHSLFQVGATVGFMLTPTIRKWIPTAQAGIEPSLFSGEWLLRMSIGAGVQRRFNNVFLGMHGGLRAAPASLTSQSYYLNFTITGLTRKKTGTHRPNLSAQALRLNAGQTNRSTTLDSDQDGIVDSIDACPFQPGVVEFNGCPDSDEDGIPDALDQCPFQKGPLQLNGCPAPDKDRDGIPDSADRCPEISGFAAYEGCPYPRAALDSFLGTISKTIQFETGSDHLLSSSIGTLQQLDSLMRTYPGLRLVIAGHTDNAGSPERNLLLSRRRADAVAQWLVRRGHTATRLLVEFFGQTVPVASNATANGKSANRRVVIRVL